MSDTKPSKKQIEALAQQIKHDQAKPLRSAEKPLKLNTTFEQAVKAIIQTKPHKLKP